MSRGRPPGFVMPQEHRDKIKNSNILHRLIACAEGTVELTSVQASVGLGLLKKVMPDVQAHVGDEAFDNVKVEVIETIVVKTTDEDSGSLPAPSEPEPV